MSHEVQTTKDQLQKEKKEENKLEKQVSNLQAEENSMSKQIKELTNKFAKEKSDHLAVEKKLKA